MEKDSKQDEDYQQPVEEQQQKVTTTPEPPPSEEQSSSESDDYVPSVDQEDDDDYEQLKEEYLELLEEVKSQSMKERNKLSKLKNDKNMTMLVRTIDKIMDETLTDTMDLTTINKIQHTGALIITNKVAPRKLGPNNKPRSGPAAWQERIQRLIDQLRGEISIISEYTKGNTSKTSRKN